MRILICFDGSTWARKSARFALRLFKNTPKHLTLLTFKRQPEHEQPGTERLPAQDKADNVGAEREPMTIERELSSLAKSEDVADASFIEGAGDLVGHLLSIAPQYDLVCLGGAGKGGFSQYTLGHIVDGVVLKGQGNLLVTKRSDSKCQNVMIAITRERAEDEHLIDYLGKLFQGSPCALTIHVLWEELPHRFEGYLQGATAEKMKQMVGQNLFQKNRAELQNLTDHLASYGLDAQASYHNMPSMEKMVEEVDPEAYDLVVIYPPSRSDGMLKRLEPKKESLNLMRKSTCNVMLLRSLGE